MMTIAHRINNIPGCMLLKIAVKNTAVKRYFDTSKSQSPNCFFVDFFKNIKAKILNFHKGKKNIEKKQYNSLIICNLN
jgi:hypothetical protein